MTRRITFYSHDGRSFGHISIMGQLSRALIAARTNIAVYGVSSSRYPHLFLPKQMDYLKLPSYVSVDEDGKTNNIPMINIEQGRFRTIRKSLVESFLYNFNSDYLVIDGHPFGKYDELLSSLRRRDSKRVGWLVRMAPDYPENVEKVLRPRMKEISKCIDDILIIGDQQLYDIVEHYQVFKGVQEKIKYLGFLCPDVDTIKPFFYKKPSIFAHIGGGGGGEKLLSNIVDACIGISNELGFGADIITGNYITEDTYNDLKNRTNDTPISISRFTNEVLQKLLGCDLFVGSAGYGTLCELISANCKSVVIPRQFDRGEQALHAKSLHNAGWIDKVVDMDSSVEDLKSAIHEVLQNKIRSKISINCFGISQFASFIGDHCGIR